jgi:Protein of unknown function (DUF3489)
MKKIRKSAAKRTRRAAIKKFAGKPVDAVRAATGADRRPRKPPAKKQSAAPPPIEAGSKADLLLSMLSAPNGATAKEVARAFGWKQHTARARISTMFRDRAIKIERTRETRRGYKKTVNVYRALPQLPLGEPRKALGNRTVRPEKPKPEKRR